MTTHHDYNHEIPGGSNGRRFVLNVSHQSSCGHDIRRVGRL